MYFIGEYPCDPDGTPIEQIRNSSQTKTLTDGVMINHTFSANPKPSGFYEDYYVEASTYCSILSGPAKVIDPAVTPKTCSPVTPDEDSRIYFRQLFRKDRARRIPGKPRPSRGSQSEGNLKHPLSDYEERLDFEIEMIKKMQFSSYFLIVWDLIKYARDHSIPVGPGRGSVVGSLVAYSLRITDIDPLQYELFFERFLNPERIAPPDIDMDYCMNRRAEMIEYVTKKYGRDNVCQIITFGTMAARGVIRDVGRSLDIPYADVDRIAKLIPEELNATIDKALEQEPRLKEEMKNPQIANLIEIAKRLEGLSRHSSTHAAGVVIAPKPLVELVPLQKTNKEEITTQYSMKDLEAIGLLKMDFLALTTLTVIDSAVRRIREEKGIDLDLSSIPLTDSKVFELFSEGKDQRDFPV